MKTKHKTILGIVLLVLAILFFIYWELIGRKTVMCKDVIVLNTDVKKGTLITEKLVNKKRVEIDSCIDNVIVYKKSIIGLEAKQYIPKNAQLAKQYFDTPSIVLNKDEKILKIPSEWLLTVPETLRRKDTIYIYAVKNEKVNINTKKEDTKQIKKFAFSTTVAYVKDGSNKEVLSLDNDRLSGTTTINSIEIVITEKQFTKLEQLTNKGFLLAVMYR